MAQLRAALVLTGFLVFTIVAIPVQYILLRVSTAGARSFPPIYFRGVCAIFGIKIHKFGQMETREAILIAANHTSYFDIVILGAVGKVSFVSKSEVADWPFFGLLAKLARTVFVERERRSKTGVHRDMIQDRLAAGDNLVLFPEGTSSDGNRVLPFKSALMGAAQISAKDKAEGRPPIKVQPVAVAYTRLHGLPMGRLFRPYFAWYGDMDLVPHLWEAAKLGPFDVVIHFYPTVTVDDFPTRKDMARHCEKKVAAGVAHALSGHDGLAACGQEECGNATDAAAPSLAHANPS